VTDQAVVADLAPTGVLRASINLGNPVPGVRVGVKEGSAYDLFLSRTLTHAEVVRGSGGIDVFREQGLEVAATIRQAIAITKNRTDTAITFLREFVETAKASGFVADALSRSGQDATVAEPS
jgi:polar amino acid transport system substrate-binding protein